MNSAIKYISYEEIIDVYEKTIEKSGGGFGGVRDKDAICSMLDFIQNDLYYPLFVDKLTYLVYSVCAGHLFNDGNKRTALTLGVYFLVQNGYLWHACTFMAQMEAIVYHVAASNIDRELLHRILQSFMEQKDYDEELQIDLARAMNNGTL
jgi:death-on-curing protein